MEVGQQVWFWIDDDRSFHHHEIISGDIYEVSSSQDKTYKIRTYKVYSTHLPIERLYVSKEDCLLALRDKKLNTILN